MPRTGGRKIQCEKAFVHVTVMGLPRKEIVLQGRIRVTLSLAMPVGKWSWCCPGRTSPQSPSSPFGPSMGFCHTAAALHGDLSPCVQICMCLCTSFPLKSSSSKIQLGCGREFCGTPGSFCREAAATRHFVLAPDQSGHENTILFDKYSQRRAAVGQQ